MTVFLSRHNHYPYLFTYGEWVPALWNMKDSQTEQLLLASEGDLMAQHKLFEAYFAYVLSITLRYMSTREVAEEVLNDIFLKVFLKLGQYDPNYPFKGWLRRIAINTCIQIFGSPPAARQDHNSLSKWH